jgi:hypothetical protein
VPENKDDSALKYDQGKIDWHSFPLVVLEGLMKVSLAGCVKYERFNCLLPFDNGDQRLFSAAMRHTVACQLDPLAVDEETGCLHGYQSAWNMLMRTYHAENREAHTPKEAAHGR